MGKKLQPKELNSIISLLPAKEQDKLRTQEITPEWLRENITYSKGLLKRDVWFGTIWFVAYSVALITTKFGQLTVSVFLLGVAYFIYTIFKSGSFGLNKKRVQVFEQLLKAIEK